jgi:predicted RNA methylase
MKRELTEAAKAAKAIRTELKEEFPGVKFSVKSSNFSMGDSVHISYVDGPLTKDVVIITGKYQQGHFDGMTDMYEYSNSRDDIPQSKYVQVGRTMSAETRDAIWKHLQETLTGCEGKDIESLIPEWNQYGSHLTYRVFSETNYYTEPEKKELSASTVEGLDFEMEKTVHTKKGHDVWVAKSSTRVGKDEFRDLLDCAKMLGGYYSSYSRDGAVPGFQFKSDEACREFVAKCSSETKEPVDNTIETSTVTSKTTTKKSDVKNEVMAAKWQKLSDSYRNESDKLYDRLKNAQTNTPKRNREYNSKKIDADILSDVSILAHGIALGYEDGTLAEELKVLQPIKNKRQLMMFVPGHANTGGYYDAFRDTVPNYKRNGNITAGLNDVGIETEAQADKILELLSALDNTSSAEKEKRKNEDRIKQLEDNFKFQKIKGFFPTPLDMGREMLSRLGITNGQTISDPSAGLGHLAAIVKEEYPDNTLKTFEIRPALSEILTLKGFDNTCADFLECDEKFDRFIMNPPFENSQDIDHVRHAYSLLNDGGRIVSIMGSGTFHNSSKKHKEFQAWIDEIGAEYETNPEGSFKGAFKSTMVGSCIVVIDK